MLNANECRELAAEYQARAERDGTTKRLANVLLSVSRSYASLATQLELLEQVEKQEIERLSRTQETELPEP
jgi:hypothetical protein